MKRLVIHIVTTAALAGASMAHALDNAAAEALMRRDGCAACHAIDKKILGPAYQDVAVKYRGDAGAAARLIDKVKKGGTGVWGQVPMPPNVQTPDADVRELVGWILALRK